RDASGDRAGRGDRRRLRALSPVGATRPAARRRAADRGIQEGRPVHRQGRRARRHHARGRRHHVGVLADQVPGGHGNTAHVHVPLEHARRARSHSRALVFPAARQSGTQRPSRTRWGGDGIVAWLRHRDTQDRNSVMEKTMKKLSIPRTLSAHDASLSIGQILERGVAVAPAQEIVYGAKLRYTYRTLAERVSRLASALTELGVEPGGTVAIMD